MSTASSRLPITAPTAIGASCPGDVATGPVDLADVTRRTWNATLSVLVVAVGVAAALFTLGQPQAALLAVAVALGWLNLAGGPCAQNAVTAITPIATSLNASRMLWYQSATAYTVAGMVSSGITGFLLATVGEPLQLGLSSGATASVLVGLATYSVLRDGFGLRLPLPQRKRSSRARFARLGQPVAAVLWGLDVGSFFSTWLTFAGAWWLVGVATLSGDAAFGAALFAAHWVGRSALVWLGPWMNPDGVLGDQLPMAWAELRPRFRRSYAALVVAATAALAAVA